MKKQITDLFGIKYPIVQGGMVWCSGWKLAAAVSNAGGLGLIGAGSMHPEMLQEHIQKCKTATDKPFGINVPLLYPEIEKIIEIIETENIKIVFTSAGNPGLWTNRLKAQGRIVVHVVSNLKFALKAQDCGVDAVVAEGFEAGGHNGREETTTLCLIPVIAKELSIPVIAAGGIASGKAMLAAFALGACGVQVGSRFVVAEESSAHINYKQALLNSNDGSTELVLKQLTPVRLFKNDFYLKIKDAENAGAEKEQLKAILGKGRAKKGMLEGDLTEGELEIGQVANQLKSIQPAKEIIEEMINEFRLEKQKLSALNL